MADDPLDDYELIFLLGLSFQQVLRRFTQRLEAAGYGDLRPVHGFALQVITRAGAVTASELAERLGVTKQATSQLVEQLVRRGYISRVAHPGGGRRRLLALTARGEQHLRDAGRILHEVERELTRNIDARRLSDTRQDLITLVRASVPPPEVPPLRPLW
jgi:DNA-binding MarR family transcriptional regulator